MVEKKDICGEIPIRGHPTAISKNLKELLETEIRENHIPTRPENIEAYFAGLTARAEEKAISDKKLHPASRLKVEICNLKEEIEQRASHGTD